MAETKKLGRLGIELAEKHQLGLGKKVKVKVVA